MNTLLDDRCSKCNKRLFFEHSKTNHKCDPQHHVYFFEYEEWFKIFATEDDIPDFIANHFEEWDQDDYTIASGNHFPVVYVFTEKEYNAILEQKNKPVDQIDRIEVYADGDGTGLKYEVYAEQTVEYYANKKD